MSARFVMLFVIFIVFVSCGKEKKGCEELYQKWTKCLHKGGVSIEELRERFHSKEEFVENCKTEKDTNLMSCLSHDSCGDFLFCTEASKKKNTKLCVKFHEELQKCAEELPPDNDIHGILAHKKQFVDDCESQKHFSCRRKKSCGDKIFCMKTLVYGADDSKGKKCGKLYDKLTSCEKDKDRRAPSKSDFIAGCKKAIEKEPFKTMVKCAEKKSCEDFEACMLGEALKELKDSTE